MKKNGSLICLLLLLGSVFADGALPAPAPSHLPEVLPEPLTNNAVAEFTLDGVQYVMSFMGLGPGKSAEDISRNAWLWRSDTAAWEAFPDMPFEQGRLAAVAVGLYDRVLLFWAKRTANGNLGRSTRPGWGKLTPTTHSKSAGPNCLCWMRPPSTAWPLPVMRHPAWCCSPAGHAGPTTSTVSVTTVCLRNPKTVCSHGTQHLPGGCAFRKLHAPRRWITAAC